MPNSNFRPIFTPDDVDQLLLTPLMATAIAGAVTTEDRTTREKKRYPLIPTDPSVSWVAEGAEIPVSEGSADEVDVIPRKLAGLSILSGELYEDTDPAAKDILGDGFVRSIAQSMDAALFGPAPANTNVQPGGLEYLGNSVTVLTGNPTDAGLAVYVDGIGAADDLGISLTHWVTDPTTAKALFKLKAGTGSNVPLLGGSATDPTARQIQGLPILRSKYVTPGTVWGLAKPTIITLIKDDAEVEADTSVYFTSHRVAIRSIARAAFGFLHPASVIKIRAAASS